MRTQVVVLLALTWAGLCTEAKDCDNTHGWLAHDGSCYFTSDLASLAEDSWHKARQYCMQNGGDLASVHSQEDTQFIIDMANDNDFKGELWIGLNRLADRDKDYSWSDSTHLDFESWASDEPQNAQLQLCVVMKTDLQDNREPSWYSANCGQKKGFVCKKNPDSDSAVTLAPTPEVPGYCPKGYWGFSNKCYKLVSMQYPDGVTWEAALEACRSEPGLQPDLASLDTPEEEAAVTARFTKHSWGYWIGYRRVNGEWLWSDNADPTYTNWGVDGHAWNDCTEIRTSSKPPGNWNTLRCDDRRGYVCQVYKDINNVQSTPGLPPSLTCEDGYTPYWYGCYRLELIPKTWSSAETHCKTLGGHLASVVDEPENAYLFATAGKQTPLWIGLEKIEYEYQWSDGWPDLYTKWAANQPSGGDGCVSMGGDGRWTDCSCSQEYPYICKMASVPAPTTPVQVEGRCPDGGWEEFGGLCYYFSAGNYKYSEGSEANEQCKTHAGADFNGRLVAIHDAFTNEMVFRKLKDKSYIDGSWIGLTRKDLDSPWEWADGSAANYFKWAPGEPNGEIGHELCTEMYSSSWPGLWNDHQCTERKPYICMTEKAPPMSTTPRVPPQGPGDCPADDWTHYGDYCFHFMPDVFSNWTHAEELCQAQQAHLASIRDENENWFIAENLREISKLPTPINVWLGLTQEEAADYTWQDGTVFSYENWAPGEPNGPKELCVEMYTSSGQWNDHFCDDRKGYVCKYKKVVLTDSSTAFPVSPTPTQKINNPTGDGMAAGAIVGIVFGVLLSCAVLCVGGYFGYNYWRKKQVPEEGFANHSYDNFQNDPNA